MSTRTVLDVIVDAWVGQGYRRVVNPGKRGAPWVKLVKGNEAVFIAKEKPGAHESGYGHRMASAPTVPFGG